MTPSTAFNLALPAGVLIFLAAAVLIAALLMAGSLPCSAIGFRAYAPLLLDGISTLPAAIAGLSDYLRRYGATARGIMFGALWFVGIGFGWAFVSLLFLIPVYVGSC
jgi:hypothetical protein